ncbi:Alpha/beta hydrolase family protein [Rubripirellula amarantea]|uniref:Alpha/beta hydrolase family protein n=1 Tax=Rubripirellula amarantea TaxID=2527999 RepID=A0A5C5WTP6_9BACT|nr:alpha/beta fold hydrolase [Rubripirellula amarantea]TWT53393.1 Alpha/beta hydrolase family protein [Rubripirellula amarantea]
MSKNTSTWHIVIIVVLFSGIGITTSKPGIAQTPDLSRQQSSDSIEILIPSHDGQLRWADVAAELGSQLRLDAPTIEQMLPAGSIDLRAGSTMLTLIGINMAAGDAIAFGIQPGSGGHEVLKVRCRRDWFDAKVDEVSPVKSMVLVDDDWPSKTRSKPMVVFLHGMNSGPQSFDTFRTAMRRRGFATAAVGYDSRQPIADSSKQVSLAMAQVFAANRQRPEICIVGHSMGGLVGLEWIENPNLDHTGVSRLITIGTPHAGSNWASLPPLADLFTDNDFDASDLVDVILHRPSAAGVTDLIPGSDFLKTLHARPRRADIRYTCIAGNVSPIDEHQIASLRSTLQSLDQDGSVVRLIRPRIAPLLDSFDEMENGKGDGIVSIQSACLIGVDDHVEAEVSHFNMITSDESVDTNPVLELILERLE